MYFNLYIDKSVLNHLKYQQGVKKVQLYFFILIYSLYSYFLYFNILYVAMFRAKTSDHLQAVR